MADRYLFKAKHVHVSKGNEHLNGQWVIGYLSGNNYINDEISDVLIDPSTICQCTGLKDKNGNLIWENDVVRGHGNPKDLAKVVFGEFCVVEVESLDKVDGVIGWHTEVIPTDAISKCEPFCLPMPLTDFYVNLSEWEVIGNIFDNQSDSIKEAWKQHTMSRFERVE